MKRRILLLPLAAALVLSGCVTVPTGPAVMVLPGPQKTFDQFQIDSNACQQFAHSVVAPAGEAAMNNAAGAAVAATAIGAAAGAIIGSATGQAGQGAAIGAGTGLLFGSAASNNVGYASSYDLQRRYDVAYVQCMYARGNQVPGQTAYRRAPVNYPPANYPAPAAAPQGYPPANYPAPTAAPRSTSPPSTPPPNTPPPVGLGTSGG
jgi:hypothetical protein